MGLVASGELYLVGSAGAPTQSIEFECQGYYTGYALTTAQGVASAYVGALPVSMTDFYGYEYDSDIIVDFTDSITWLTQDYDGYQSLYIDGRHPGDIITLELNIDFDEIFEGMNCRVYYSENEGSWVYLGNYLASANVDVEITSVSDSDSIRIRIDLNSTGGQGEVTVTLTGGTITTGSGTVTAAGSTTWFMEYP